MLRTLTSALGHYDPDTADNSPDANYRKAVRLTAQIGSLVATMGRVASGGGPIEPDPVLGHAANFLYMLTGQRPGGLETRAFEPMHMEMAAPATVTDQAAMDHSAMGHMGSPAAEAGKSAAVDHAAMGHGELSATGLEMPAETTITVHLRKCARLAGPRIESPAEILAVASGGFPVLRHLTRGLTYRDPGRVVVLAQGSPYFGIRMGFRDRETAVFRARSHSLEGIATYMWTPTVFQSARGHREVIAGNDTVLTFEPHPLAVVRPEAAPKLLMSFDAKVTRIEQLGVRELVVIPFDETFAAQNPEAFIDEVLVGRLQATHVSVGENFRFGHRATGDPELLAADPRFLTRVVTLVEVDGEIVSSSHIRALVSAGDVDHAAHFLGSPFRMVGEVVAGDRRGRTLGFPTANIVPDENLVCPGHGVYAAHADGSCAAVSALSTVGNSRLLLS